MMEAIERYCSKFRDEYLDRLIRGSYQQLSGAHHILDPQQLILPGFSDFRSEVVLHWVWGFDLGARKEILVPASAVYHPFSLDEKSPVKTHTNGLAFGNTMGEAIFHGMTEVIECDALRDALEINRLMIKTPADRDKDRHLILGERQHESDGRVGHRVWCGAKQKNEKMTCRHKVTKNPSSGKRGLFMHIK